MQQREISSRSKQLSTLPAGTVGVLSFIENDKNCHVLRLCELGLILGVRVELRKKGVRGSPSLLRFNDLDLCVDAELTRNLWVEGTAGEAL